VDPSLALAVEQLARVHRENRFAVVEIMSTNAVERLRTAAIRRLAQAFRLREPKKCVGD
jgi:hypothetical protein